MSNAAKSATPTPAIPPHSISAAPPAWVETLVGAGKTGPALGILENSTYTTSRRPIAAGDGLIFFTDGLYEVEGANGVYYDMNLLQNAVERRMNQPCSAAFDELLSEIREFASGGEFQDDVCLVGVEIAGVATAGAAAELQLSVAQAQKLRFSPATN